MEPGAQEPSTHSPVFGPQYSGVWYSEPGSSLGSLRNVLSSNSQALVWGVWKASHRGGTSQCSCVLGTAEVCGRSSGLEEGGVRGEVGRQAGTRAPRPPHQQVQALLLIPSQGSERSCALKALGSAGRTAGA